MCLSPAGLLEFVSFTGFMGVYVALNKINRISPAYKVVHLQEMTWPFGEFSYKKGPLNVWPQCDYVELCLQYSGLTGNNILCDFIILMICYDNLAI